MEQVRGREQCTANVALYVERAGIRARYRVGGRAGLGGGAWVGGACEEGCAFARPFEVAMKPRCFGAKLTEF